MCLEKIRLDAHQWRRRRWSASVTLENPSPRISPPFAPIARPFPCSGYSSIAHRSPFKRKTTLFIQNRSHSINISPRFHQQSAPLSSRPERLPSAKAASSPCPISRRPSRSLIPDPSSLLFPRQAHFGQMPFKSLTPNHFHLNPNLPVISAKLLFWYRHRKDAAPDDSGTQACLPPGRKPAFFHSKSANLPMETMSAFRCKIWKNRHNSFVSDTCERGRLFSSTCGGAFP